MGVSKNGGTPKWMVYNGKPYSNGWFGGTTIFGNTHIYIYIYVCLIYWRKRLITDWFLMFVIIRLHLTSRVLCRTRMPQWPANTIYFWLVLTGKLKVCHWKFFSPFRCQKSSQDVWQLSLHWFVSVWPKFPRYFHHPNSNLQLNTPLGHCAYRPGDIIIKASWPFQLFIGWNSLWWWNFSVRERMELGYRYIMVYGNMNHHELTNR